MNQINDFLYQGPIKHSDIINVYSELEKDAEVGAFSSFYGRVRSDKINGNLFVEGIDYSAYSEMAKKRFVSIIKDCNAKYKTEKIIIWHSVGFVRAGETSLLIAVSSKHRKDALAAVEFLVTCCKYHVPIWKKEILSNNQFRWVDETKHIHHNEATIKEGK